MDKPADSVNFNCPCKNDSIAITPPYVGTDYYGESDVYVCCPWNTVVAGDPLWDGQQCGGGEASCCTNSNCHGSSRYSTKPPLRTLK